MHVETVTLIGDFIQYVSLFVDLSHTTSSSRLKSEYALTKGVIRNARVSFDVRS